MGDVLLMINPEAITNYNLTDMELEEHILFWVCAAGKNGRTAARCLDELMYNLKLHSHSPFDTLNLLSAHEVISSVITLPMLLKACGIGCYNQKAKTMYQLAKAKVFGMDLRTCTIDELETIYGIGKKTSRCFIIHSRENSRCAGLDTHILKFLRAKGVENVPKMTPSSKKEYDRLEKEFLKLADEVNKTVAEFDLDIWNQYSVKTLTNKK